MNLKWQDELHLYREFKTIFVLEGNIYDKFPYKKESNPRYLYQSLEKYLYDYYKNTLKYDIVLFVNSIDGIYPFKGSKKEDDFEEYSKLKKKMIKDQPIKNGENQKPPKFPFGLINIFDENEFGGRDNLIVKMTPYIKMIYENEEKSVVFILTQASRYAIEPDHLQSEELSYFTELSMATQKRVVAGNKNNNPDGNPNQLILITEKANDLPFWFYFNNPYLKVINIDTPTKDERKAYLLNNLETMFGYDDLKQNKTLLDEIISKFVGSTDGLKTIEIDALIKLMQKEDIPLTRLAEGITLFKYGIKKNPWDDESLFKKINSLETDLKEKIFGQDEAIRQAVDIIRRAIYGFSGIQNKNSQKPKGVMFLSGPTGTGKTELAKLISEWTFNKSDALIRFDMSEFQQEHSDQRLLGAPPGYVGYSEGGQLTNAVKNNPFSILLFDEIEKAHPKILDKFLQILDDGRMTDGRGETVYFSDTIIIFTSNLGVKEYKYDPVSGKTISPNKINYDHTQSYEEYEKQIIDSIKTHFDEIIGRPELLNRFGDNFLVFNYISKKATLSILKNQLITVKKRLAEDKKIQLSWSDLIFNKLYEKAESFRSKGGRGIITLVEKHFINPLVRLIAEQSDQQKEGFTIELSDIVFEVSKTNLIGVITQ